MIEISIILLIGIAIWLILAIRLNRYFKRAEADARKALKHLEEVKNAHNS